MRKVLALFAFTALTSACETGRPRAELQQRFLSTVPYCDTEQSCAYKWSRARRFVLDNAGLKIQHYSSDFIETYNAFDYASTSLAARIVKEPVNDKGRYRITFEVWCNNWLGCVPDKWETAVAFNAYVNAGETNETHAHEITPKATTGATQSVDRDYYGNPKPKELSKNDFKANQMAKSLGCEPPTLLSATGATETFQAACPGGQYKLIQCEFTNCKVMQ